MRYERSSPLMGLGEATSSDIQRWFEKRNPNTPANLGAIIVAESSRGGVNEDIVAAQIAHETGWWTSAIANNKRNPAGLGAVNDNAYDGAVTFPTIQAGIHAQVAHLLTYIDGAQNPWRDDDPRYQATVTSDMFGQARTIADLEQHWAWTPPTQYTATPVSQRYASRIAQLANDLVAQIGESVMPKRPYHVAISYGHHNTDGGNITEKEQTPRLGRAVADACRALGMDVRIVQDAVGLNPSIGLQQIAQHVVDWDRGGWPVDLYLETHTEAGPRGVFSIYPDTGNDVDLDAKRVGKDAANRIAQTVGIPLRGDGTMSERQTGVGAEGYRLGIFLITAAIKDHCTRMIIEYGSHTNGADLAAVNGHIDACGSATAQAFAVEARRLGFPVKDAPDATPQQVSDPNIYTDPVTGYRIIGGMLARWNQLKAALSTISPEEIVLVVGRPVGNERVDDDGVTRQNFEHETWEWQPGQAPERFDILATIANPYTPAA